MKRLHKIPMIFMLCSLFMVLFSSFVLSGSGTLLNNSYIYNSFEDMPTTSTENNGSLGGTLTLSDISMATTFRKLGDWAITDIDGTNGTDNVAGSQPVSIGGWFYFYDTSSSTTYKMFHFGGQTFETQAGIAARAVTGSSGVIIQADLGENSGSSSCQAVNHVLIETNNEISLNEWHYIVVVVPVAESGSKIFIDGVDVNTTFTGSATSLQYNGKYYVGEEQDPCWSDAGSQSWIDELGVWKTQLNQSNINVLYNNGNGNNPYSDVLPEQIASIGAITIGTFSNVTVNMTNYFLQMTWASLNFSYDSANYFVNYSSFTANTGDFAITPLSQSTFKFFSFGEQVSQFPISMQVCNSNGCINTTIYFEISGYGIPTQIASIADIDTVSLQVVTREFSDYFSNYNNRFIQYVSPDNSSRTINVSSLSSDSNSCFYASISGDTARFQSKTKSCSVSMRFIVDDGTYSAISNYFTYTVRAPQANTATAYFTNFLSVFPSSDDISTSVRVMIILLIIGFTGYMGIVYMNNASEQYVKNLVIAVTSIAIILEIIFFTVIGYIPVWLIVIILILGVIIAIGSFRSIVIGGV